MELLTRKPQHDGIDDQDIPASFSPVTSMIAIRDEHRSMTVLTDRPLGGTSFKPGRIELLVNRKTHSHDSGGMGRPFNLVSELTMEMVLHFDDRPKHTEHNKFDRFYFLQDTFLRDLFARLLRMSVQMANPL